MTRASFIRWAEARGWQHSNFKPRTDKEKKRFMISNYQYLTLDKYRMRVCSKVVVFEIGKDDHWERVKVWRLGHLEIGANGNIKHKDGHPQDARATVKSSVQRHQNASVE